MALDLGCRGAAVGLFLLVMGVRLRERCGGIGARLTAALALSAAAYAISASPIFPQQWQWWSLPILALAWGAPATFWLWALAAFDDDFGLRPWHALVWIVLVGLGFLASSGTIAWPALGTVIRAQSLLSLGLAVLAVAQTLATWGTDLVAGRRRLRFVVLIGTLAYIAAGAVSGLSLTPTGPSTGSAVRAFGLYVLAMLGGWSLFRAEERDQKRGFVLAKANFFDEGGRLPPVGKDQPGAIEQALLRRLEGLMTQERAYRREGLTIGALAAQLGLPEYRLRALINEGLGHRNFNAFLNRYRIEEAKAALADSDQAGVPVLTIALDAGFRSIGPFNRAFKATTGVTPTEYRRASLARGVV
jgi:AraC-like DNA-binding protein